MNGRFRNFPAPPAGVGAANARRARFARQSPSGGQRAAGPPADIGPLLNPLINSYAQVLWDNLTPTFSCQVVYWPVNGSSQPLTVIWKEGMEDEDTSPGRYSHILVNHADLPRPPQLGDVVIAAGVDYDTVRIDAYTLGFSKVVLQRHSVDI